MQQILQLIPLRGGCNVQSVMIFGLERSGFKFTMTLRDVACTAAELYYLYLPLVEHYNHHKGEFIAGLQYKSPSVSAGST